MALMSAGLVLSVCAAAVCGPDVGARGGLESPTPREATMMAVTGTKTVAYAGYVIEVPAGWPVYRLATQPHRCVRYDVHAVYLGTPGPDQQCPAHLVGRTEAVRIDSTVTGAESSGRLAGGASGRLSGGAASSRLVRGASPGLSVTATYAGNPAMVERIIASVHGAPRPAPVVSVAMPASLVPASLLALSAPKWAARARATKAAAAARPGKVFAHGPIAGFDTCTAPSVRAMRAWRRAYAAIGVYIGGVNRACDAGNLTRHWVRRVKAMGWWLIPTYVGLQPPCDHFSARIKPRHAITEGSAAADDAIAQARSLGLHRHAPIYVDMEAYNDTKRRCRRAVLAFLDSWTRRLRARGYVPGVYSSAGSGVEDLGNTTSIAGHPLARPKSIWFALWDGRRNVRGGPYMLASWWPGERRIKQFHGAVWRKHGGFRLNIDIDRVFGAVY